MITNDNSIYNDKQGNIKRCGRCIKMNEKPAVVDVNEASSEVSTELSGFGLIGYPLASVYSPIQNFTNIYDCENGLSRGTIFSELDFPFVCGGMNGGAYRG